MGLAVVLDDHGQVRYFEPAVLSAPDGQNAEEKLKLWARYSDTDGGVLEDVIAYGPGETPERTLVLLKPDNFQFPTGRPGNMIDFFSRAGLFIVGIKVHQMSVAQAMEFYRLVRPTLCAKYQEVMAERVPPLLREAFGFEVPAPTAEKLGELLGPLAGGGLGGELVEQDRLADDDRERLGHLLDHPGEARAGRGRSRDHPRTGLGGRRRRAGCGRQEQEPRARGQLEVTQAAGPRERLADGRIERRAGHRPLEA